MDAPAGRESLPAPEDVASSPPQLGKHLDQHLSQGEVKIIQRVLRATSYDGSKPPERSAVEVGLTILHLERIDVGGADGTFFADLELHCRWRDRAFEADADMIGLRKRGAFANGVVAAGHRAGDPWPDYVIKPIQPAACESTRPLVELTNAADTARVDGSLRCFLSPNDPPGIVCSTERFRGTFRCCGGGAPNTAPAAADWPLEVHALPLVLSLPRLSDVTRQLQPRGEVPPHALPRDEMPPPPPKEHPPTKEHPPRSQQRQRQQQPPPQQPQQQPSAASPLPTALPQGGPYRRALPTAPTTALPTAPTTAPTTALPHFLEAKAWVLGPTSNWSWHDAPRVSTSTDAQGRASLLVSLSVARQVPTMALAAMVLTSALGGFGFGAFAIEASDVRARVGLSLALLLAVIGVQLWSLLSLLLSAMSLGGGGAPLRTAASSSTTSSSASTFSSLLPLTTSVGVPSIGAVAGAHVGAPSSPLERLALVACATLLAIGLESAVLSAALPHLGQWGLVADRLCLLLLLGGWGFYHATVFHSLLLRIADLEQSPAAAAAIAAAAAAAAAASPSSTYALPLAQYSASWPSKRLARRRTSCDVLCGALAAAGDYVSAALSRAHDDLVGAPASSPAFETTPTTARRSPFAPSPFFRPAGCAAGGSCAYQPLHEPNTALEGGEWNTCAVERLGRAASGASPRAGFAPLSSPHRLSILPPSPPSPPPQPPPLPPPPLALTMEATQSHVGIISDVISVEGQDEGMSDEPPPYEPSPFEPSPGATPWLHGEGDGSGDGAHSEAEATLESVTEALRQATLLLDETNSNGATRSPGELHA